MLNGLDLFSGIGGITLALSPWVKPVAYCENDRYAQAVLLTRMQSGALPIAPIWDDIRTLRGSLLPSIDIIYGGFPCQDVSIAGARKGLDGERTGLFREAIRLVRECQPKFVFLENVPGIRRYVPSVRGELEKIGYDCRDGFLSAAEVGALHIRNRWWLLANSNGGRSHAEQEQAQKRKSSTLFSRDGAKGEMGNAECARELQSKGSQQNERRRTGYSSRWPIEPDVGRVAHGVPARSHRLKGLGNAVVPQCAREAFKTLIGLSHEAEG